MIKDYSSFINESTKNNGKFVIKPSYKNLSKFKVRDWYITKYPTDNLGNNIDKDLTFDYICNFLNGDIKASSDDFYKSICNDSVIRERIFAMFAELYGVKYDDVYNKWLDID